MKEQKRKTILLVEDDTGIVEILQLVLETEGYRVGVLTRGTAMPSLQEPYPDLILLDLLLSGMDGRAICRHLKGQEATSRIPIILMSANKQVPQIAREVGADGWLAKPFETETLLTLLETSIPQGEEQREQVG
jgi:CheY-like chemotaxis protein